MSALLAFDEMMPATQVSFKDKSLDFTFDTGAIHTTLNPAFAKGVSRSGAIRNKEGPHPDGTGRQNDEKVRTPAVDTLAFRKTG